MTNGKLSIQNPDSYDSADYQCRVSNKMGAILSNPVKLTFGCKFFIKTYSTVRYIV